MEFWISIVTISNMKLEAWSKNKNLIQLNEWKNQKFESSFALVNNTELKFSSIMMPQWGDFSVVQECVWPSLQDLILNPLESLDPCKLWDIYYKKVYKSYPCQPAKVS